MTTIQHREHSVSPPCNFTAVLSPTSLVHNRDKCSATRHGTADAYQHHHCRCPSARRELRRQVKRRQLAHIRGHAPIVNAVGTRRRLQALAVLGYSLRELGRHLHRTANTVHDWQTQRSVVTRATSDAVSGLYDRLADRRSNGPRVARVRNDALRKGWLPPIAWDDDTIDDPDFTVSSVQLLENEDRDVATVIDQVAIDRYLSGDHTVTLTREEKEAAWGQLVSSGYAPSAAGARLGMSGATVRRHTASAADVHRSTTQLSPDDGPDRLRDPEVVGGVVPRCAQRPPRGDRRMSISGPPLDSTDDRRTA